MMTDPIKPPVPPKRPNSRTDTGTVELAPNELSKAGVVSVEGGVLTVKNEELANLIHSKLADASKLLPTGLRATDVDVSVGVKIK
jgi:hypothetical protein